MTESSCRAAALLSFRVFHTKHPSSGFARRLPSTHSVALRQRPIRRSRPTCIGRISAVLPMRVLTPPRHAVIQRRFADRRLLRMRSLRWVTESLRPVTPSSSAVLLTAASCACDRVTPSEDKPGLSPAAEGDRAKPEERGRRDQNRINAVAMFCQMEYPNRTMGRWSIFS